MINSYSNFAGNGKFTGDGGNSSANSIGSNESFFTGHLDLQTLEFDPFIGGYAFIIWTKIPTWMKSTFPNFIEFTQKNFKSFDGIGDMSLESADYEHTFNGNAYGVASNISKENTSFTLKHQEFSGSPVRKMYQYWVSGIRDPRTGIATYPKIFNLPYAAKNHTGELMYIVTRPDADNVTSDNIEFAAYYTNVYPTSIPLSHLNYSQNSHDLAEIDIEFRGTMNISAKVDEYAYKLLGDAYAINPEGVFDPTTVIGDSNPYGSDTPNLGNPDWNSSDLSKNLFNS